MVQVTIILLGTQVIIVKINLCKYSNAVLSSSVLVIGAASFIMLVSYQELANSIEFSDLTYYAKILDPTEGAERDLLDRNLALAKRISTTSGVCRSDIVNAGLFFVLLDLDTQNSFYRYDDWNTALGNARDYVIHGLTCNPADGRLWAGLALIEQVGGATNEKVATLMLTSSKLNPSEIDTIQARFVVWNQANAETLEIAKDAVKQDVRNVSKYADRGIRKKLLRRTKRPLDAYITQATSEKAGT